MTIVSSELAFSSNFKRSSARTRVLDGVMREACKGRPYPIIRQLGRLLSTIPLRKIAIVAQYADMFARFCVCVQQTRE
jgi:hypothetical protein